MANICCCRRGTRVIIQPDRCLSGKHAAVVGCNLNKQPILSPRSLRVTLKAKLTFCGVVISYYAMWCFFYCAPAILRWQKPKENSLFPKLQTPTPMKLRMTSVSFYWVIWRRTRTPSARWFYKNRSCRSLFLFALF